jgi:class 3 adenylate cyclase
MNSKQLPQDIIDIIEKQEQKFKKIVTTKSVDQIPEKSSDYPSEASDKWLKIEDVICVYVDMKNSTQFSASSHGATTGKIYTLFTGTAVRIFKKFGASYIDIRGDGVFGLFDKSKVHSALASAVTMKTFSQEVFVPKVQAKKADFDTGIHIGIDQRTLLASKIGLNKTKDKTDMFNEVWAGKAVNFASKIASYSTNNEVFVSEQYYRNIKCRKALMSCSCGDEVSLWNEVDTSWESKVPVDKLYKLESNWCKVHGAEYLQEIIEADD